jgi:YfiH family protein
MMRPLLSYYPVADGVTAFSTTRHGGVSSGNYGEFNINEYCGDEAEAIKTNRSSLCTEINIDEAHLVMPHQTHGTEVRIIAEEFLSLPFETRKMLVEGVDAVVTDVRGVCVGVSTADCIPVLLYDEEHHVCAAVHAGWRGTVKSIVLKAIAEMRAAFATSPSSLTACIGPGISLQHFEVGDEVYEEFAQAGFPMDKISRKYDKWHIDLPECNRLQLLSAGVDAQRIICSDVCTYSRSDEYFSARRLGIDSGRIFTGIIMKL